MNRTVTFSNEVEVKLSHTRGDYWFWRIEFIGEKTLRGRTATRWGALRQAKRRLRQKRSSRSETVYINVN